MFMFSQPDIAMPLMKVSAFLITWAYPCLQIALVNWDLVDDGRSQGFWCSTLGDRMSVDYDSNKSLAHRRLLVGSSYALVRFDGNWNCTVRACL